MPIKGNPVGEQCYGVRKAGSNSGEEPSGVSWLRAKIVAMPFDREILEANLALNLIASADMPSIAWDAWEAGLGDGPGTMRLGALERPTYFEVAEVLPRVMKELGLSQIPRNQAALRLARQMAKEILESGDDPLKHLPDFESLWIRAGYPPEIGKLGSLHDNVWIAESTGQSISKIREDVTSTLKSFINRSPPRTGR